MSEALIRSCADPRDFLSLLTLPNTDDLVLFTSREAPDTPARGPVVRIRSWFGGGSDANFHRRGTWLLKAFAEASENPRQSGLFHGDVKGIRVEDRTLFLDDDVVTDSHPSAFSEPFRYLVLEFGQAGWYGIRSVQKNQAGEEKRREGPTVWVNTQEMGATERGVVISFFEAGRAAHPIALARGLTRD